MKRNRCAVPSRRSKRQRRVKTESLLNLGAGVLATIIAFLSRRDFRPLTQCSSLYRQQLFAVCAPLLHWQSSKLPKIMSSVFYDRIKHLYCNCILPLYGFPVFFHTKLLQSVPSLFGLFPASLVSLTLFDFDKPLSDYQFPTSLTSLTFGPIFNQPLAKGDLPTGLKKLTFGSHFDQKLQVGVLPGGLLDLRFGSFFHSELLPAVLPVGLTDLTFGRNFNLPLSPGVFPISLLRLTFGALFNQPLREGVFPDGLAYLDLGQMFDQPMPLGVLPNELVHLKMGRNLHKPLVLPTGGFLSNVKMSHCFNLTLFRGFFPNSVSTIVFGHEFNQVLVAGCLPSSLTDLVFGGNFCSDLHSGVLPQNLTTLSFGACFNKPLIFGALPSRLTSIKFGLMFDQPGEMCKLPASLTNILFENPYNYPLALGILMAEDRVVSTDSCLIRDLPQHLVSRIQQIFRADIKDSSWKASYNMQANGRVVFRIFKK